MLAQKQQLLVRYYLWAVDGPWRLPNQLHHDLIDHEVALRQFAGTKQKVLEVFARRIGTDTYALQGRGTIFTWEYRSPPRYTRALPDAVQGFLAELGWSAKS